MVVLCTDIYKEKLFRLVTTQKDIMSLISFKAMPSKKHIAKTENCIK